MIKRLVLFLLLAAPAFATTRYVAATAGTFTGGSACNGQTAITVATWNGLTLAPGDTTYLCGTITGAANATGLVVPSSGSSGSPLQVIFDTGAVLTSPIWNGNTSTGGAINTNGQSYITINGGPLCGWSSATLSVTACNGSIVNTAAGTGLTYNNSSIGIDIPVPSTHVLIENLDCHNIYQYTASSGDNDSNYTNQNCVNIGYTGSGGSYITIQNSVMHDAGWLINSGYDYIQIGPGVELYNADHMIANASVHGYVFNDHFHGWKLWDNGSSFHHDGLHCYAGSGGASEVYYVYNNQFDDDGSVSGMNAYVFMEGDSGTACFVPSATGGLYLFNNVGVDSGLTGAYYYALGNGSGTNANNMANLVMVNNTSIGNNSTDTGANGGMAFCYANNFQFQNNATDGLPPLIAQKCNYTNYASNPDYNFWENWSSSGSYAFQANGVSSNSFATWQAGGNDAHGGASESSTTYFGLNSACTVGSVAQNCAPVTGSPLIAAGTNLYSLCNGQPNPGLGALCYDITGAARPSSGAWTVGAYNSTSTSTPHTLWWGR
jgi:hypothetical protein